MKSVLLIDDKESIGKVVSIYVGKDYDFTFFIREGKGHAII